MEPGEKLAFSLTLRGLSPDQRLQFLQDCLLRGEPERTTLLALILSHWAETAPVAAAEWILANLERESANKCVNDIARTWAARDGEGLAHWVDDLIRGNPSDLAKYFNSAALDALEVHDPFWQARLAEMECNRGWTYLGMDYSRSFRTPEAVKAMGARLGGHVAYIDDLIELKRQFAGGSGNRNIATKNLFNQLFQDTAVAWHGMNPAECDAWLNTFPENAQMAARHFIGLAEEEAKTNAAPDANAAPPASAASAGESVAAAVPDGESFAGLMPGSPQAEQAASGDWTTWWKHDAPAAEAFLNNSAWPGNLKLRIRAAAYSSPP